jgi:hypothetical protein
LALACGPSVPQAAALPVRFTPPPSQPQVIPQAATSTSPAEVVTKPPALKTSRKRMDPQERPVTPPRKPPGTATLPASDVVLLSLPSDRDHLNELHCFVRQHVEVFAATKEDTLAPAPGRKTRVLLGQVGLRCVHCARLPIKDRVLRAVCYPPSIGGIYHSVSNMKFDHFVKCKGLPALDRTKFSTLRASCSRRGVKEGSRSKDGTSSSSTAQYYCDAATRVGLVDTEDEGIRFAHAVRSSSDVVKSDMPTATTADGISALMMMAAEQAPDSARKRPRCVSSSC